METVKLGLIVGLGMVALEWVALNAITGDLRLELIEKASLNRIEWQSRPDGL